MILASSIGSFSCGLIADLFGRRTVLILGQLPLLLSWILIAVAHEKWVIFLGRVLSGIGDGALFSLLPVYNSEISHKDSRGNQL